MEMNAELIIGLSSVTLVLCALYRFIKKEDEVPFPVEPEHMIISDEVRILQDNLPWLKERWDGAYQAQKGENVGLIFPEWFFDPATERQLRRIKKTIPGVKSFDWELLKGQASDIIGLYEPAEREDEEILEFFKISSACANQTRARHEVGILFHDPENVKKWHEKLVADKNRPAAPMQREFYRFIGRKSAPAGLTTSEAEIFIDDYYENLSDDEIKNFDIEWSAFQDLFEMINDPLYSDDYKIKKVSLSLYRSVIERLRNDGETIAAISDDVHCFIERLIEMKPEIQKGHCGVS